MPNNIQAANKAIAFPPRDKAVKGPTEKDATVEHKMIIPKKNKGCGGIA